MCFKSIIYEIISALSTRIEDEIALLWCEKRWAMPKIDAALGDEIRIT
jgi:hypothetical protein